MNSVDEVHPQLTNNGHPVDGALVGGCWFTVAQNNVSFPFGESHILRNVHQMLGLYFVKF
jgi:hypothetical protein